MSAHYDVLLEFFEEDEWPVEELDDLIIRTAFKGESGTFVCVAQARPDAETLSFYVVSPRDVPEAQRARMAEFVTRANYGLAWVALELDMDDGSMRCRGGIQIQEEDLTVDIVQKLVYLTVVTMDRYYPGITGLLLTSKSPKSLIEAIEST